MHLTVDSNGRFNALGGRVLAAGPGQRLLTLLDTETARAAHTEAALPQAGADFLAAVNQRAAGNIAAGHDLPALDRAVAEALRALTTAQLDAAQAASDLAQAEQGVRAAFDKADKEAVALGPHGFVAWDGKQFVAVLDEAARQADEAEAETERQNAAARAKRLAVLRERAAADPDFALLAELAGVDLGA